MVLGSSGEHERKSKITRGRGRRRDAFGRMTDFVNPARGIVVLDRPTDGADGRDGTDRSGSLIGAWPVSVLQVDRNGKLGRAIKRPGVRHHLVEGCAAIKATEGKREPGTGCCKRLEAKGRQDAR